MTARAVQVGQMVDTYRKFMKRADTRVGIDGRSADICCVIADILHHGRGGSMTWPLIQDALESSKPLTRLLEIGMPKWKTRRDGLKNAIAARPMLAQKRWRRTSGDFV